MTIDAFCIHGHFYQPPREDPLTGEIPLEPGAAPYHDWNERIFYECYRPNAEQGNFERISFNIGPTLFNWLEKFDRSTARKIIEQDQANVRRFGVGNAMAQAYNHTILPLASRRDKLTQVRWGIADFHHRFGRTPKGMWLPETAADQQTLEVLAECGIEFTILAPWQAEKPLRNPYQPAVVHLPGGKKLAIFFYNQDLSTRISFDPSVTINADDFIVNLLTPRFNQIGPTSRTPSLLMAASDGELYGHHQAFREKFLAYLLDGALTGRDFTPMFPELWLKRFPPKQSVTILEKTSWSCHHGVTRWMGECGCTPKGSWKAVFRVAMDTLAEKLDRVYEATMLPIVPDPWELRDRSVNVFLGEDSLENLTAELAGRRLSADEVRTAHYLLGAQFERQRMFTSCGWFFDDFDRIEPKNNVAYAAQAVWLTRLATGVNLESEAKQLLKRVSSNRSRIHADTVFAYHIHRAQTAFSGFGPEAGETLANSSKSFPI